MYHDYQDSLNRDPETVPRYFITGNSGTMLSNRISHFYDLRGPSVTVDTACSTTLTALHLACQSLRTGESDTAGIVGANLLFNADAFVTMSNLGFLSPDGISYAFEWLWSWGRSCRSGIEGSPKRVTKILSEPSFKRQHLTKMAKHPPLLRRVIWHRNVSSGSATVKPAWICHIPRTWRRREVAERRPFLASPAAEKGSQIAKRNSYLVEF